MSPNRWRIWGMRVKEVPEALARLAKKYKLVILSNGDRDMLEAAKPYLGHTFDATISVQEAGYFKPHRRTYEVAADILGFSPVECMHVAKHAFDALEPRPPACAPPSSIAAIGRAGRPNTNLT